MNHESHEMDERCERFSRVSRPFAPFVFRAQQRKAERQAEHLFQALLQLVTKTQLLLSPIKQVAQHSGATTATIEHDVPYFSLIPLLCRE